MDRKEAILPSPVFNKDLQEEVYPDPEVVNVWRKKGERTWFRILVPHTHHSCISQSRCGGMINIRISTGANGVASGPCLKCGNEKIEVDLTILRLEVRQVFELFILERNLPK